MDPTHKPQDRRSRRHTNETIEQKVANYYNGVYGPPDPKFDPTSRVHLLWLLSLKEPTQPKIDKESQQRRAAEEWRLRQKAGAERNWNGRDFGNEFGGEFGNEFGGEFGNEYGHEFGGEFGWEHGDGRGEKAKDFTFDEI